MNYTDKNLVQYLYHREPPKVKGFNWINPHNRVALYRYMMALLCDNPKRVEEYTAYLPPLNRVSRDAAHRAWNGYRWEIQ